MTDDRDPPMEPAIREAIDEKLSKGIPRPHHVSVETARKLVSDGIEELTESQQMDDVGSINDYNIEGPNGQIPVRIYTPEGAEELPVFVWYHGGGWVRSSISAADPLCRKFTNLIHCSVVSVGYRLAPEHPFPHGLLDCFTATKWAADNPRITRGDGGRLSIGGPSAGGNLAAAVAAMFADNDLGDIAYQVLGVPAVEADFNRESYRVNASGNGLTTADMKYYWSHYVERNIDRVHPYAAPNMRKDVSGLPPALVVTAGYDPLRDEGREYAKRLRDAGVPTDELHYPTLPHGIFNPAHVYNDIPVSVNAINDIADHIREAFDSRAM